MGHLCLHQLTIIMMKVFAIVFGLLFVVGLVSCGPNGNDKTGPCFQTCEEDSDCNDPKPGGCNVCKTYTVNFMDKDVTFNRCSALVAPSARSESVCGNFRFSDNDCDDSMLGGCSICTLEMEKGLGGFEYPVQRCRACSSLKRSPESMVQCSK